MTPFWFIVLALVAYGIAYLWYSKWYDRNVWKSDPAKTTPAHMFMDGVEFFPSSRYVLWGYQFKSIAALGPILGPWIAVTYGWLPALIWIIVGNFFIGWIHDYGSIMLTVRNEGKSFGPLTYEWVGAGGRNTLLGFLLFYLLIISAVFIMFIALFWNIFPGTIWATLGMIVTGLIAGQLLYKMKMNILTVTIISIVLVVVSVFLGVWFPFPATGFLGAWTLAFWAAVLCVILYIASMLPMPTFIQPVNYVAFYPAFIGVLLIIIGSLLSPVTNITLLQPAWKTAYSAAAGPIWPMMFVAIACGAISGWHSLVGSSATGKQLDIETDAHPVGAGAMLTEGLLALAALAAFMVLAPDETALGNVGGFVTGATRLTTAYLGAGTETFLKVFFGLFLVIYAFTVQTLVTRFWRMISAELFGESALGQPVVSTIVGLSIAWLFAISGSWINLWLYFGGANQLLAGLALMLISIYLVRLRARSGFTLGPAIFMIVTTLAALAWETWMFLRALVTRAPLVRAPLASYPTIALAINGIFVLVGAALFILGIRMALLTWGSYSKYRAAPPAEAPAE